MSCIRDEWERFMMVDSIMSSQVVSTACKVFDIDLNRCKVDDL